MLNVIPLEMDHFDRIKATREKLMEECFGASYRDVVSAYRKHGPSWAAVNEDGDVIAIGGVVNLWRGVGEAWTVMGEKVTEYPLSMTKVLLAIVEKVRLRRIHASVRADDRQARKLIELCGFVSEGVMQGFGANGEDYLMYARVKEVSDAVSP